MITITDVQNITDHCLKVLSCTEYLRRDSNMKEAYKFAESMFESIRKLFIGAMLYEKILICVSGLQGAGKTTLMKNFYGIDEKYLYITQGRGERIPVLITERSDVKEPSIHAIKIDKDLNGNYIRWDVEISVDEIVNAVRGEDEKIMYLELYVPYMYTNNENISFVLLPGFERGNSYWNNLIEFSVNSSDAAVFVFNETSFSNAENENYLNMIEKRFGRSLVYAISGSDGSLDENKEVKQTCIQTLNVPSNETDRVVCVGSYTDDAKNKAWINHFKSALEKYAYKEGKLQQVQNNSKYLYIEIEKIKEKLYEILDILNNDSNLSLIDHHNDKLLEAFDRAVAKKKKIFEKNLASEFERAKGESIEKLEKQFSESSKLNTAKRLFFGSNVKEKYTKSRETVEKALMYDEKISLPDKYIKSALEYSLKSLDQPKQKTEIGRLIDTRKEDDKNVLLIDSENTQAVKNDICTILADNGQNKVNYTLQSSDHKKLVCAVAEVGTYYYSLFSHSEIAKKTGLEYYEPAQTELVPDKVLSGAATSKKFVAGMAGLMGIDLIGDGTINMVAQMARSLCIPLSAAATAAGAIVGAGAAMAVIKDINRMQCEDFWSAKIAVCSIYDSLKKDELEKYEDCMDIIRERIEDNIIGLGGEGKKIIKAYNAKVEVNNALNLLEEFSEEYAKDIYGLESAFAQ